MKLNFTMAPRKKHLTTEIITVAILKTISKN